MDSNLVTALDEIDTRGDNADVRLYSAQNDGVDFFRKRFQMNVELRHAHGELGLFDDRRSIRQALGDLRHRSAQAFRILFGDEDRNFEDGGGLGETSDVRDQVREMRNRRSEPLLDVADEQYAPIRIQPTVRHVRNYGPKLVEISDGSYRTLHSTRDVD